MRYCVINQKGGVAKSTTANALQSGLKKRGYRVLCVDMDSQGTLTDDFRVKPDTLKDIMSAMLKLTKPKDAVVHTTRGDIIPYNSLLVKADSLFSIDRKEYLLKDVLDELEPDYDYIVIDTPPALGISSLNALIACDGVIIPANPDRASTRGLLQLIDTIETARRFNPDIRLEGILLTCFNPRTMATQAVVDALGKLAKDINAKVFDAKIRQSTIIRETEIVGEDLFSYAPTSPVAKDYSAFIDELLQRRK